MKNKKDASKNLKKFLLKVENQFYRKETTRSHIHETNSVSYSSASNGVGERKNKAIICLTNTSDGVEAGFIGGSHVLNRVPHKKAKSITFSIMERVEAKF